MQGGYIRQERPYVTFAALFTDEKREKKKSFFMITYLSEFFSLVRKERKGQKEESFDSRLGDADTHASHMCQSLF